MSVTKILITMDKIMFPKSGLNQSGCRYGETSQGGT